MLQLQLISPFSTASAGSLVTEARERAQTGAQEAGKDRCSVKKSDRINQAFTDRLCTIARELGEPDPSATVPEHFFVRTIGRDYGQIELLVKELQARGLGDGTDRRVILLREWDSIYARTFADLLKARLAPEGVTLEIYSYLRGLDGATVDGAPKQQRLVPRSSDKDGDRKPRPEIEWPESRDQRDYVRRLVASIEQGAARKRESAHDGAKAPGIPAAVSRMAPLESRTRRPTAAPSRSRRSARAVSSR